MILQAYAGRWNVQCNFARCFLWSSRRLSKTIYTSGNALPLRLRGDDAAASVMCWLLCFVLRGGKYDSGRAVSGEPNPKCSGLGFEEQRFRNDVYWLLLCTVIVRVLCWGVSGIAKAEWLALCQLLIERRVVHNGNCIKCTRGCWRDVDGNWQTESIAHVFFILFFYVRHYSHFFLFLFFFVQIFRFYYEYLDISLYV